MTHLTDEFHESSVEIRELERIQFGILSPDEIRAMSVCEILTAEKYDGDIPKTDGLLDLRMGTTDPRLACATCSMDYIECPGHFGHLELARPMIHIGLFTIILKTLRCICWHCSRLLVDRSSKAFKEVISSANAQERLRGILQLCSKVRQCGGKDTSFDDSIMSLGTITNENDNEKERSGCGHFQPKYTREGLRVYREFPADVKIEGSVDRKRAITAGEIHELFRKISQTDAEAMGFDWTFSRPEWFILTVLPISPPTVRPSVSFGSMKSSDDLTYALANVVKFNNIVRKQDERGAIPHILNEYVDLVQYHLATLFDNELNGQPQALQKSGKPIKSLRQRLVGKAGRVRQNLMGKRVDFSARTVITGDPNLDIDQVGVPRSIAMNLTYPEVVTHHNIEEMRKLVLNGPNVHPGAKTIIRDNHAKISLRHVKRQNDRHLEVGYVVERHIRDGDFILFNRQPSLHKMSLMCHTVKVMPWSSFRLNISVTTPYNADFDGDEMNLHVPQTVMTRAEAEGLMRVPRQIVSPQSNKPVIGIVQDTLLAVRRMTLKDTFIDRYTLNNVLMHLESWDGHIPKPCILKPKPLWSGKQVFQLITPNINLMRKANGHPDSDKSPNPVTDTKVLILQGRLITGIIDKQTVGNKPNSLIHVTWNELGPDRTRRFISECQKVCNYWLWGTSFSVGVSDGIVGDDVIQQVRTRIDKAQDEVQNYISQARSGKLERQPGRSNLESFEVKVNEVLNKAREDSGELVLKRLNKRNRIKQMVLAGSKGSTVNICQIIACVAQQNVQGKRIATGFTNRTLPHFVKDDFGPEAGGFVENSYLKGLTPQEFFSCYGWS